MVRNGWKRRFLCTLFLFSLLLPLFLPPFFPINLGHSTRLYHTPRVTLFSYTLPRPSSFFPLPPSIHRFREFRPANDAPSSIDFPGNEGDCRDIKNREQPGDERRLLFAVIECNDRSSAEKTLERIDLVEEGRGGEEIERGKIGKGRMVHCDRIGLSSCAWPGSLSIRDRKTPRGIEFFSFYYPFNSQWPTRAKWKRILRASLCQSILSCFSRSMHTL